MDVCAKGDKQSTVYKIDYFPYFVNISKPQKTLSQIFNRIGQLGVGLTLAGGILNSALYNVDGGHRAVIFDRFQGTY